MSVKVLSNTTRHDVPRTQDVIFSMQREIPNGPGSTDA